MSFFKVTLPNDLISLVKFLTAMFC